MISNGESTTLHAEKMLQRSMYNIVYCKLLNIYNTHVPYPIWTLVVLEYGQL